MIYTIGDSHCKFGWSKINGVKCLHLGPKLMHTFSRSYNQIIDINFINNLDDCEYLIFCFGEIDCRNHIHKFAKKRGHEKVIRSLTSSYVSAINDIKSKLKSNINIGIYMVPPPSRENQERYHDKHNINYVNPFPLVGTDEERKAYYEFMNKSIHNHCIENNFIFINPYEAYCDSDGFLRAELADEDSLIHIEDESFLLEELKVKGLI